MTGDNGAGYKAVAQRILSETNINKAETSGNPVRQGRRGILLGM